MLRHRCPRRLRRPSRAATEGAPNPRALTGAPSATSPSSASLTGSAMRTSSTSATSATPARTATASSGAPIPSTSTTRTLTAARRVPTRTASCGIRRRRRHGMFFPRFLLPFRAFTFLFPLLSPPWLVPGRRDSRLTRPFASCHTRHQRTRQS